MATTMPWHSRKQNVYHNNTRCPSGQRIDSVDLRIGTGGKTLCDRCGQLNQDVDRGPAPTVDAPSSRPVRAERMQEHTTLRLFLGPEQDPAGHPDYDRYVTEGWLDAGRYVVSDDDGYSVALVRLERLDEKAAETTAPVLPGQES